MKRHVGPVQLSLFVLLLLSLSACVPPDRNVPAPNNEPTRTDRRSDREDPTGEGQVPGPSANDPVLLPKELPCRVVGVHDGDTITVLDATKHQYKIRLAGIDAPELGQDFGRQSKESLSGLVFGKDVVILHDKVDRYGRIVGKIIVDGRDANLAMIEAGLAWHFKKYEKEQAQADRQVYNLAEVKARKDRMGLWIQPNPVPPWDYRGR